MCGFVGSQLAHWSKIDGLILKECIFFCGVILVQIAQNFGPPGTRNTLSKKTCPKVAKQVNLVNTRGHVSFSNPQTILVLFSAWRTGNIDKRQGKSHFALESG